MGRLRSPYVFFVVIALVLGGLVWTLALRGSDVATEAAACPVTPAAEEAGLREQPASALDSVVPALLADTRVRVLNANGQSGQAGAVAAQLAESGFQPAGADATGNDPVYAQALECHGQIRYGEAGQATARSLSLAAPCMQLVDDGRDDASADLVLGTIFSRLSDSAAAVAALDELKVGRQPITTELEAARSVNC
ncbi:envelope integrity protein Cei [Rhodococcus sp. IEGM 1408]|uniref:envelope integrity protein Cei n=1 Tax=Rhodococcus sp. IEGM 1408 TaxID=3082220 RepID=UPI002955CC98|nr:envelope integrity protein Cei [Rhodococcus sp. IEGM 1408]MDV8002717.1 envelope integrity protein Cei [Rhodococcus sp. IEGM 1408]